MTAPCWHPQGIPAGSLASSPAEPKGHISRDRGHHHLVIWILEHKAAGGVHCGEAHGRKNVVALRAWPRRWLGPLAERARGAPPCLSAAVHMCAALSFQSRTIGHTIAQHCSSQARAATRLHIAHFPHRSAFSHQAPPQHLAGTALPTPAAAWTCLQVKMQAEFTRCVHRASRTCPQTCNQPAGCLCSNGTVRVALHRHFLLKHCGPCPRLYSMQQVESAQPAHPQQSLTAAIGAQQHVEGAAGHIQADTIQHLPGKSNKRGFKSEGHCNWMLGGGWRKGRP